MINQCAIKLSLNTLQLLDMKRVQGKSEAAPNQSVLRCELTNNSNNNATHEMISRTMCFEMHTTSVCLQPFARKF